MSTIISSWHLNRLTKDPQYGRIRPHQNEVTLAKAGLFYSRYGDIVICAFCGIHLYRWLPNDDPFTEHKKFSKNCKFISLFQDINHQPRRANNFSESVNAVMSN